MFVAKMFVTKMSTAKIPDRKAAASCVTLGRTSKPHPTGPTPVFVNQISLETSHTHSLAYSLWMLLCTMAEVRSVTDL